MLRWKIFSKILFYACKNTFFVVDEGWHLWYHRKEWNQDWRTNIQQHTGEEMLCNSLRWSFLHHFLPFSMTEEASITTISSVSGDTSDTFLADLVSIKPDKHVDISVFTWRSTSWCVHLFKMVWALLMIIDVIVNLTVLVFLRPTDQKCSSSHSWGSICSIYLGLLSNKSTSPLIFFI